MIVFSMKTWTPKCDYWTSWLGLVGIFGSFSTHCRQSTLINSQQTPSTRLPNAGLVLAHRLRRWPNIKLALGERLVFAGLLLLPSDHNIHK